MRTQRFAELPDYAFPRLRALIADITPPDKPQINMTIGEPQHAVPDFVAPLLAENIHLYRKYPPVDGTSAFREAVMGWLCRRYGVSEFEPDGRILPLSGTREGLFISTLAVCPEHKNGKQAKVLIPNPFYQCYAAATLACGAQPVYLPTSRATNDLPDYTAIDRETLNQTAAVFLCAPSNPQGAVASLDYWCAWLKLAEKHDFIIMADECYADIYCDDAPTGILQAVQHLGADPNRVAAFHSLSKRSNLAGLRSGFVTSGPQTLEAMRRLRAYGGAPCPLPTLAVSTAAWSDDAHVETNRQLYRQKFAIADEVFKDYAGYQRPAGGFFVWLAVPDGEQLTRDLWQFDGVKVLPGAYLSRTVDGVNPGAGYIRIALVDTDHDTIRMGLEAIRARVKK